MSRRDSNGPMVYLDLHSTCPEQVHLCPLFIFNKLTASSEVMIALRILALWDRNKLVLGILVAAIIVNSFLPFTTACSHLPQGNGLCPHNVHYSVVKLYYL